MPDPAWLTTLRTALFAQPGLPAEEDAFTWEGETYVCQRTLTDDGTRAAFKETWLDPRTLQQQKTWTVELDSGSWAGVIPGTVYHQQVVQLAAWLQQARPRRPVRPERREFNPYRFARSKGPGGLR